MASAKLSLIPKTSFRVDMIKKPSFDPRAEKLYLAVVHQDWSAAQALLNEGAPCNFQSSWGRTALHSALFENHVKNAPAGFFEALVQSSKSIIDAGTDSGNTALHWACTFATKTEVEALLKAGANASLTNKEGRTALDVAKDKASPEILAAFAAAGVL